MTHELEQTKQQNKLDPQWINRILEKCENVGVSKTIILRFTNHYLDKEK